MIEAISQQSNLPSHLVTVCEAVSNSAKKNTRLNAYISSCMAEILYPITVPLQLDLLIPHTISKIAMQGCSGTTIYVTKLKIHVSNDSLSWQVLTDAATGEDIVSSFHCNLNASSEQ